MRKNKYITILLLCFVSSLCLSQQTDCSLIYHIHNANYISAFDPSQPLSTNNPSNTSVPVPFGGGSQGQYLALLPNINGGTLTPTFYSYGGPQNTYFYWDGVNWVNTGHLSGTGHATNVPTYTAFRGLAGCPGRLYDLVVTNQIVNTASVYVYNGSGNGSLLTVLPHGVSVQDLTTDCNCNFYVLDNSNPQSLRMYDQFGSPQCSYTLTTAIPTTTFGGGNNNNGGLAMVGNSVYVRTNSGPGFQGSLWMGLLGGSTISFSEVATTYSPIAGSNFVYTSDFASCPVCNTNSVTVAASSGTVNCYTPTAVVSVTATTNLSPVSYSWSGPGLIASTFSNAAASVTASGTYTCLVMAGGCAPFQPPAQSIVTVAVTTDTTPTLASISPSTGICPYPWAQVVASPGTTLYSSSWQGPGIVSGANSPTLTLNMGGTYSLTLTNILNGCSDSKTLSVINAPVFTLSASATTLCSQNFNASPATITLNAQGGTSYTLQSSSSFSSSVVTGSQYPIVPIAPFPSALQPVTATVIGFDGTCTNSVAVSFSIVPNPTISISPASTSICAGQSAILSASGASSYTWSPATGLNTTNATSVSANPALTSIYSVIGSSLGCQSALAQTTLTVQALPVINILPNNPGVCLNTTTVSLNASGTGSSFTWSPATGLSSTNGQIVQASPTSPQTYTVVASLNSCTSSALTSLTVVPAPSLSVSLSSPSLCAQALSGSPNSITLTSGGANTYTLVTPLHITSTSPSGPIVPISTQPPYSTGVASATLYGSNGVCTVSTTANFNVIPNPSLTVLSNTPVICAGESFTYTSFGAASYTWGPNSPNLTTYSVGEVAVVNPSINSVFSVVGGSLGCYSAVKELSLTVYPLPQIDLTPISPSICLNSKIQLEANGTGTSYTWAPSLGLSGIFGSSVLASPQNDQQYTLTASANNCTSSAVITVSVLPLPSPQITLNKTAVCLNEEIVFTGSGGQSYTWNGPYLVNRQENPLVIKADHTFKAGTYTLTVSDEKGCQASSTAAFSIYDLPDGSLKGTMQACVPFESEYSFVKNSHASDAIQVYWLRGSQQINNKKFSYRFDTPGTYTFTGFYQDTLTMCKNTENFIITALPKPKADFQTEPAKPMANLEEVLFVNTSQGQALNKYRWHFFNNSGYESQQKNTAYLFTDPGKYLIVLEVENSYGCKDTAIKTIQIEEDYSMYVPNAFTPNGDGTNDVFLPVIRAVKAYELRIFDRWGRQLFQSSDPNQGWDGTKAGQDCKQDSYVWKIHLSTQSGLEKEVEGFVLLTR